jgi:hypothetical protein
MANLILKSNAGRIIEFSRESENFSMVATTREQDSQIADVG